MNIFSLRNSINVPLKSFRYLSSIFNGILNCVSIAFKNKYFTIVLFPLPALPSIVIYCLFLKRAAIESVGILSPEKASVLVFFYQFFVQIVVDKSLLDFLAILYEAKFLRSNYDYILQLGTLKSYYE